MSGFDEEAYEKFKEEYDPSDEVMKRLEADRALDRRMAEQQVATLNQGYRTLSRVATKVGRSIEELRSIEKQIASDKVELMSTVGDLDAALQRTMVWWNEQTEEIRKMMLWMASMGFKVDLE